MKQKIFGYQILKLQKRKIITYLFDAFLGWATFFANFVASLWLLIMANNRATTHDTHRI